MICAPSDVLPSLCAKKSYSCASPNSCACFGALKEASCAWYRLNVALTVITKRIYPVAGITFECCGKYHYQVQHYHHILIIIAVGVVR